jgi:hypothetical protein
MKHTAFETQDGAEICASLDRIGHILEEAFPSAVRPSYPRRRIDTVTARELAARFREFTEGAEDNILSWLREEVQP